MTHPGEDPADVDIDAEADRRRVESPCIGVCVIDEATDLCAGCLRSLEEVALWGGSSADQRRKILDNVVRRRAQLPIHSG